MAKVFGFGRFFVLAGFLACIASTWAARSAHAQLTGTKNIPGDYATLAAAVTDLNTQGVGAGGVTLNLVAGNPQTAPAGGYVVGGTGSLVLTTTSAANQVTIEGNGNTVTAFAGQTSGNLNDSVFKLIGADWITIQDFTMQENPANTTTAAGTNNMTEWGVALLYVTTTDGAQNNTIKNNTISLNRTYQNTFGIYSNSTHTATSVTTSATATGANGGNHNLKVYGNSISSVNLGIVVVGPTAVADADTGIDVGGAGGAQANSVTNFGTTGTFSGYANVSGTVNGILVRNSNGFNVSFNTVTSSVGGTTAGTLNGIQIPAASNAPTATFTNNINSNNISLQSAVTAGAINGINYPSGSASATSTMNVNGNNFSTTGHTVAASGAIVFITMTSTHQFVSISNNTFTNMSVNTTGSVTFVSNSTTSPANSTKTINGNSIVTGFSKTGAGGTVTLFTDNGSDPATAVDTNSNNNFSNITVTGATTIAGWSQTNGGSPAKTISGNTFSNWTGGTSSIQALASNFGGTNVNVTNNTISNITYAPTATGTILTGISIGSSNSGATQTYSGNTISGLSSTGTGGQVIGILGGSTSITTLNINGNTVSGISTTSTAGPVVAGVFSQNTGANTNIFKNKVYDITCTPGAVIGINSTAAAAANTINIYNNYVGRLYASASTFFQSARGLLLQSTVAATFNVSDNTVYLDGTTPTQTYCVYIGGATNNVPNVNAIDNIFVNNVTSNNGAALPQTAYFRLGTTTATNLASTTNNNLLYAGTPAVDHLIYVDGAVGALTNPQQTLASYQAFVTARESASVTELPPFLNTTTGSSANYLHIDPSVVTQAESGGIPITSPISITDDYDGDARNATTPDIGADEFNGIAGILGACCLPTGCAQTTQTTCTNGGGTLWQQGVDCANAGCPPTGQCCAGDGTCSIRTQASCLAFGNGAVWNGGITSCGTPCATGSCCIGLACSIKTHSGCDFVSGIYGGDGSTCSPVAYPLGQVVQGNTLLEDISGDAGATQLALGDDSSSASIALPFNFNYYGNARNAAFINSNGWLSFNANGGISTSQMRVNAALPSGAALPNEFIAPLWDDLNEVTATADKIAYMTKGTAPQRRFIVQWFVRTFSGTNAGCNNFEAVLYEGSSCIEFRYATIIPNGSLCGTAGTASFNTGVEDLSGLVGTDMTALVTSNKSLLFCPSGGCAPPTGSCCVGAMPCQVVTQAACQLQGGVYNGDNTGCSPDPCVTGACCFDTQACQQLTSTACGLAGGTYLGDNHPCSECPPLGVCCTGTGSCSVRTQASCLAFDGGATWDGNSVSCGAGSCPTGACCLANGSCVIRTAAGCTFLNGCYQLDGSSCNGGAILVFSENFDSVTAPALPAGWTASNASGAALWVTSTTGPDTAPNDAFIDDPITVSDKRLDSPSIAMPSLGTAVLSFRNNYDLESGFDGGVLEISINGGAFADIVTAGGVFTAGGYNATISTSFSSPIAGRQAWSGTAGAYITSTVNLPGSTAGQNIVLRWRMASDTSAGNTGWRVDTITLNVSQPPCPLISTNPASVAACVGDSVSFTVGASGAGLTYQWRKGGNPLSNGGNISGADTATLTINPVGTGDAGSYDVVVTSGNCSKISTAATLSVDSTPPTIDGCPGDIGPVNNDAGLCSAVVSWTAPTASDNCPGVTLGSDHSPGDSFPVGTTLVTYTATDTAGLTATCSFNVTVVDAENPTIGPCPSDIQQNTDAGQPYATVTWTPPVYGDNCLGAILSSNHNPGDHFFCGQTSVTYTVTDAVGHTAMCGFTVTVTDAEFPVFQGCPTTIVQGTDPGICTATVSWTEPTATDNKGTPVVGQTQGPPSGSSFPIGTTHIQYTATDPQSNTSYCDFDVMVSDNENPTIAGCPSNIISNTNAPNCAAVVSWTAPTATDNCPGVSISQTAGPASGSTFGNGSTTTIQYTATDAAGHNSICSFTVTVTATPDVNDDASFDLNDVAPFVNVVLGLDTTPLHVYRADANCDGTVNGLDVSPFVHALVP